MKNMIRSLIIAAVFAAAVGPAAGAARPASPAGPASVSLLPAATEILFALGAGDAVKGITYHSADLPDATGKTIVGGFFYPSMERIAAASPEVIFYAPVHRRVEPAFAGTGVRLVQIDIGSIEDGLFAIDRIGEIVDRRKEAGIIVEGIRSELALIREKTDRIPASSRLRVLRVMSTDPLMVPGDDSFQNEMIRAAGGIPPVLGKTGPAVEMTQKEWVGFDPQVIYGCGGHLSAADPLFSKPGWNTVAAVEKGRIFDFPCNMTCRAGLRTADFVSWLSARLYKDEFSRADRLVREETVVDSRVVPLDVGYVQAARVDRSRIWDFVNRTLLVAFTEPMAVLSTLEGPRRGVRVVCNHYASPPLWEIAYSDGLEPFRRRVLSVTNTQAETASLLFTGVDMAHLATAKAEFRDLAVTALVTAGVAGNAMRMAKDPGGFYEPGTINIVLLPAARLSSRAMSRALITATEAKSAALLDLDVRSTYSGRRHRATGTGTDNIVVVEGRGPAIDNTGGHSKMGELIARAVYDGVRKALAIHNGVTASRSVFRRMDERGISLFALLQQSPCECVQNKPGALAELEQILLVPRYAGFIEAAFALSDAYEQGLVQDPDTFAAHCRQIAQELSGRDIDRLEDLIGGDSLPPVLAMAFNALLNGIQDETVGQP